MKNDTLVVLSSVRARGAFFMHRAAGVILPHRTSVG